MEEDKDEKEEEEKKHKMVGTSAMIKKKTF